MDSRQRQTMPAKNKSPNKSSQENADDHVPVVVHRKQHHNIRDSELCHMQESPDELLEDVWGESSLRLEKRCRRLG